MFPIRFAAGACLLLGAVPAVGWAQADDPTAANPGRPTVSTPATLTPVGYLQFEMGGQIAAKSPEFDRRFGLNLVTKYTVAPRLQLLALTEPVVTASGAEHEEPRSGEVFGGMQAVLLPGEGSKPTLSVSYIRRLYESPAPEVDIGSFRQGAIVLLSADVHGFHYDLNGIVNEQAEVHPRRAQFGQTLSVSHPVKKLTVSGEVYHFSQPLTQGSLFGTLLAGAYPLRPNLVVDVALDHGWTGTSTRWEGLLGITYVLPKKLWSFGGR